MPSPKRVQANKINARASTGPKTTRGKAVSKANSVRHGILSQELMLPHENPAEFDELLGALIAELHAVGTLECTLVERIAVAIWRQRRVVRAERQDIQRQNASAVDGGGSNNIGPHKIVLMNDSAVIRHTLAAEPFASNLVALEREARMLPAFVHMSFGQYTEAFPLFSRILPAPTAEEASRPFAEVDLTKMYGPPLELQAQWLPAILDAQRAGAKLQAERSALQAASTPTNAESLARYQAALDNEWYKAMRAFREARQYRLRTLDSAQNYETNPNGEVD